VIKSRWLGWLEHVAHMGNIMNSYNVLKTEGKKPFRTPKRRWKNNIKMDLKEIGLEEDVACNNLYIYNPKEQFSGADSD
jgi:hypothetical protein